MRGPFEVNLFGTVRAFDRIETQTKKAAFQFVIGTSISDFQNHPVIRGNGTFTDYVLTLVSGNTLQGFHQTSQVIVSNDNKSSLFDIKKKVEDFMTINVKKVKEVF